MPLDDHKQLHCNSAKMALIPFIFICEGLINGGVNQLRRSFCKLPVQICGVHVKFITHTFHASCPECVRKYIFKNECLFCTQPPFPHYWLVLVSPGTDQGDPEDLDHSQFLKFFLPQITWHIISLIFHYLSYCKGKYSSLTSFSM